MRIIPIISQGKRCADDSGECCGNRRRSQRACHRQVPAAVGVFGDLLQSRQPRRRPVGDRQSERHVVRLPVAPHQYQQSDESLFRLRIADRLPRVSQPRADGRVVRNVCTSFRRVRAGPFRRTRHNRVAGRRRALCDSDVVRRCARYDAVVVATGILWDAVEPEFTGRFSGPRLHANYYRDPTTPVDLRGKRVLVTGLGNSGCESPSIAAENGPGMTWVSARSGQLILQRPGAGAPAPPHPADPVPSPLRMLPKWARDRLFPLIFRRVMRRVFGGTGLTPQDVGLPPPPANLCQTRRRQRRHPALHQSGDISAKPDVARLVDGAVEFTDGTTEGIDDRTCNRLSLFGAVPVAGDTGGRRSSRPAFVSRRDAPRAPQPVRRRRDARAVLYLAAVRTTGAVGRGALTRRRSSSLGKARPANGLSGARSPV